MISPEMTRDDHINHDPTTELRRLKKEKHLEKKSFFTPFPTHPTQNWKRLENKREKRY